jgi:hypothetical protein
MVQSLSYRGLFFDQDDLRYGGLTGIDWAFPKFGFLKLMIAYFHAGSIFVGAA